MLFCFGAMGVDTSPNVICNPLQELGFWCEQPMAIAPYMVDRRSSLDMSNYLYRGLG